MPRGIPNKPKSVVHTVQGINDLGTALRLAIIGSRLPDEIKVTTIIGVLAGFVAASTRPEYYGRACLAALNLFTAGLDRGFDNLKAVQRREAARLKMARRRKIKKVAAVELPKKSHGRKSRKRSRRAKKR